MLFPMKRSALGLRKEITIFEHERGRSFGENKTITILGKWLRSLVRRLVLGRQRGEQGKTNERFRRQ